MGLCRIRDTVESRPCFSVLEYRRRGEIGDRQPGLVLGEHRQRIALSWTKCPFGGIRPWFDCPECRGKAVKLYGGGRGLCCQRCYGLVHQCQREQPHDRALRKMAKLRRQLPGLGKGSLDKKPRGWHRSTWEEWIAAYRSAIERTDKVKFLDRLLLDRL